MTDAVKAYTSSCDQSLVEVVIDLYAKLDSNYCDFLKVIAVVFADIYISVGGL